MSDSSRPKLPPAPSFAAEEREECFRVVTELAEEFAYADRVEADGSIVPEWITPAFTRITGYTRDELVDRPEGFVLVHPDDLPEYERHVRQVLSGEPDEAEVRIVTRSGSIRWIHSRIAPVWDEKGKRIIRIHGTARDITARKQAESEMRLHASVFQSLPIGVYVWRLEDDSDLRSFRVVTANPASTWITGVPADSVIGKTIAEAFPALLHTDIPGQFRLVIRSGQALDLGRVRYGDERVAERVFAMRAFPLSADSVGVAFEDVSASDRAQASLRRAEETLARVLQSSSTAVLVLAADSGQIMDVNERALELLGYQREEMLGQTPIDLRIWVHAADYRVQLQQMQSTGKPVNGHAAFRRQNRESFHSLFWLESMDYHNRPAVVLMLMEAPERRSWKRGL